MIIRKLKRSFPDAEFSLNLYASNRDLCYYYGQKVTKAEFIRLKELEKEVMRYEFLNRQEVHNGFAYKKVAVLKPNESRDNFEVVEMEWGIVATYLKNRDAVEKFRNAYRDEGGKWNIGYTTLNAKDENLFLSEGAKVHVR